MAVVPAGEREWDRLLSAILADVAIRGAFRCFAAHRPADGEVPLQ